MQKDFVSKSLTLPPNVRGKSRGFIELEFLNLRFKDDYRFEKTNIILKILWWGQIKTKASLITFEKKKFPKNPTIEYSILTNCKLFYNYLLNCEPIQIFLLTKTSNYQIGFVNARIPTKLLKACNNFLIGETLACNETQTYSIHNQKGRIIGDIKMKFGMMFFDPVTDRENILSTNVNYLSPKEKVLAVDKEVEKILSSRNITDSKYNLIENEIKDICSARVVNYLSGKQMTKTDQEKALKEIRRTSPLSERILEDLRIDIPKSPEHFEKIEPSSCRNDEFLNGETTKKESLYLYIKYLKLLPPGVREVFVKSLIKTSFTVECKISPNLLDSDLKRKLNYDVMRFYSNTFNDEEQRIDFNNDAIRSIRLVQNRYSPLTEHKDILFTIWWREFGSRYSRCLGTTKFRFTDLLNNFEREKDLKLSVKSCTAGIHVANLFCKIMLTSASIFDVDSTKNDSSRFVTCSKFICSNSNNNSFSNRTKETPNNQDFKGNNVTHNSVQNTEQQVNTSSMCAHFNSAGREQHSDGDCNNSNTVQTTSKDNLENNTILKGLLHIGEMQNMNVNNDLKYFCVVRAFWKDDASSSGFAHENDFNFIEVFTIINDSKFIERVKNNFLIVEIWQKSTETQERLCGIARLPLHQFYIAFRDPVLANHLFKNKLPVISIDGLTQIVTPLSGIVCGQMKTLLCVGTEDQINCLKQSRGLNLEDVLNHQNSSFTHSPVIAVPELSLKDNENYVNSKMGSSKSENGPSVPKIDEQTKRTENINKKDKLTNILEHFLDNISQKLPVVPTGNAMPNSAIPSQETIAEHLPANENSNVKRTSDLLDIVQKALSQQPTAETLNVLNAPKVDSTIHLHSNTFKIYLEIECALHLPRNPGKFANKKNKRNKGKQTRFPPNEEPSAYVTFQAEESSGQMFKSHEGMVYATNVVEKCSSPVWNKRFQISVSVEYLLKENKPFMLRVWKKASTDLAQCRLLPTPMEDSMIGVASIDLTVLMAKMPFICGWYNIIDFSGKINGQIKININPLEDVLKFKNISKSSSHTKISSGNHSLLNTPSTSKNVQSDINDVNLGFGFDMSLSKAFKRKLVELEEINQRLRARLLDVTGEADSDFDLSEVDDEQMDEFERDLNTECEENDNIGETFISSEQLACFSWMKENGFNDDDENVENENGNFNMTDQQNGRADNIDTISKNLEKTEIQENENH